MQETTSSTLRFALTAVPEPNSWALMLAGFGLAGVGVRTRRRSGGCSLTTR